MSFAQRIAAQRQAIAERQASFTRAYKFKVGKTHIRLLPGVKDKEKIEREYGAHYIKNPSTDQIVAVVGDASICYGKEDPIRSLIGEVIANAQARANDDLAAKAKGWLAKRVFVCNAQIVGGVDTENKGKVVQPEFSSTSWDSICSAIESVMEVLGDNFDIGNGVIITVERVGTTQNDTRYTFQPYLEQPKTAPTAAVLDGRLDLDTLVDSKFGESVNKALTALSAMLGRDLSSSAIGVALEQTKAIADGNTSAATSTPSKAPEDVVDVDFDEVLTGDTIPDTAPKVEQAATAPADDFDSILADLDNI